MEVDWLDTVTSVVYLGGMEVDWLDGHCSRLSWGYALTGLAQSLQSFIWGLPRLTALSQSIRSFIWGYGG